MGADAAPAGEAATSSVADSTARPVQAASVL
jgi:hypothetical protein